MNGMFQAGSCDATFGLFLDIDGVICRGREILPFAKEAFQLLTDKSGNFLVPTIFVTNAGNVKRYQKAAQLSEWLNINVSLKSKV